MPLAINRESLNRMVLRVDTMTDEVVGRGQTKAVRAVLDGLEGYDANVLVAGLLNFGLKRLGFSPKERLQFLEEVVAKS